MTTGPWAPVWTSDLWWGRTIFPSYCSFFEGRLVNSADSKSSLIAICGQGRKKFCSTSCGFISPCGLALLSGADMKSKATQRGGEMLLSGVSTKWLQAGHEICSWSSFSIVSGSVQTLYLPSSHLWKKKSLHLVDKCSEWQHDFQLRTKDLDHSVSLWLYHSGVCLSQGQAFPLSTHNNVKIFNDIPIYFFLMHTSTTFPHTELHTWSPWPLRMKERRQSPAPEEMHPLPLLSWVGSPARMWNYQVRWMQISLDMHWRERLQ